MREVQIVESLKYGFRAFLYFVGSVLLGGAGIALGVAVSYNSVTVFGTGGDPVVYDTPELIAGVVLIMLGGGVLYTGLFGLLYKLLADAVSIGVENTESTESPLTQTATQPQDGNQAETTPRDTQSGDSTALAQTGRGMDQAGETQEPATATTSQRSSAGSEVHAGTAPASAGGEERPASAQPAEDRSEERQSATQADQTHGTAVEQEDETGVGETPTVEQATSEGAGTESIDRETHPQSGPGSTDGDVPESATQREESPEQKASSGESAEEWGPPGENVQSGSAVAEDEPGEEHSEEEGQERSAGEIAFGDPERAQRHTDRTERGESTEEENKQPPVEDEADEPVVPEYDEIPNETETSKDDGDDPLSDPLDES